MKDFEQRLKELEEELETIKSKESWKSLYEKVKSGEVCPQCAELLPVCVCPVQDFEAPF